MKIVNYNVPPLITNSFLAMDVVLLHSINIEIK